MADTLISAFDSAGQRCSALRLLCLQDDVADRILHMLKGALAELAVGQPDRLSVDIGPVISAEARDGIERHVAAMRAAGYPVHRAPLPPGCANGTFIAPTIVEIPDVAALEREVFGPVLHVLRFRRGAMASLMQAVNGTGYALTFGVHTRIDETVAQIVTAAEAGNVYVNRNIVGAVVGVQPFGGHGLSGTGPKAGGPLYLRRLLAAVPAGTALPGNDAPAVRSWDSAFGTSEASPAPFGVRLELPGPVGEENVYRTQARGVVGCLAHTDAGLKAQVRAALATGNKALLPEGAAARLGTIPGDLGRWIVEAADVLAAPEMDALLFEGDEPALLAAQGAVAARKGAIVPVLVARPDGHYPSGLLVLERSVSTNTTAAGGNANLMMIG